MPQARSTGGIALRQSMESGENKLTHKIGSGLVTDDWWPSKQGDLVSAEIGIFDFQLYFVVELNSTPGTFNKVHYSEQEYDSANGWCRDLSAGLQWGQMDRCDVAEMRSVKSNFCVIDHKNELIEGCFALIMCMYIYLMRRICLSSLNMLWSSWAVTNSIGKNTAQVPQGIAW